MPPAPRTLASLAYALGGLIVTGAPYIVSAIAA
jgi:hypothetical protein